MRPSISNSHGTSVRDCYRAAFGSTARHPKCSSILSGGVLATLLGRHVRLLELESKTTRFLEVNDVNVVETLAVVAAPLGKYCALLQRATLPDSTDSIHQVAVVNLKLGKIVRTIRPNASLTTSTVIVDLSFSDAHSKNLVISYGKPDPVVVTYRWYTEKVVGSVRLERVVLGVHFSPTADTILTALTVNSLHELTQDLRKESYNSRTLHERPAVCPNSRILVRSWRRVLTF